MGAYRIITFDGGGIRGLMTARILEQLAIDVPTLIGNTRMFAGTSTGGIIALGLANGMSAAEIGNFYSSRGKEIFDDNFFDDILDFGKLIGADYSDKPRKKVLGQVFGKTTLRDLKKRVAITAFDLDNEGRDEKGTPKTRSWKPKIFHNTPTTDKDPDLDRLVVDVAMYTSAAPTYFPSSDGYVDGGVYANNPSLVALAQAVSIRNTKAERAALDDVCLLSIGTGFSPRFIEGKRLDWGKAQWIDPLISILFDGVSGIADYQASQLLGDRYKRIQVEFPSNTKIETDSVDKMPLLENLAKDYCTRNEYKEIVSWAKTIWAK